MRYEQVVDGLPVYGAYLKAAFDRNGNLIHMIDALADVPTSAVLSAKADAATALKATMRRVHPNVSATFTTLTSTTAGAPFDGGDFFYQAPSVKAVVLPMTTTARWPRAGGWKPGPRRPTCSTTTLVGSTGSVLYTERQTASPTTTSTRWTPKPRRRPSSAARTAGCPSINLQQVRNAARQWVVDGNNVSAYLDVDNNNSPDGASLGDTMSLLLPWNAAETPSSANNKKVALTNLFYLNNTIHDILYSHGVTESAKNFQKKTPPGTAARAATTCAPKRRTEAAPTTPTSPATTPTAPPRACRCTCGAAVAR